MLACLALFAAAAVADAPAQDQGQAIRDLANKLMQTETVLAVMNVTDPAKFVPDSDPDTLQIVYVQNPKLGTNHVSDDGEVVWFFGDVDVDDQQPYILRAFEIQAKRRLGIK